MRRLEEAAPPRRHVRRLLLSGVLAALVLAVPSRPGAAAGTVAPGGPAATGVPAGTAAPVRPGGTGGPGGETVSLAGNGPGERLDVTLTRVVDPTAPAGAVPAAATADRLVAVRFRLVNTGTAVYRDSPAPAAHLLDADGHRFTGSNAATTAGPPFPETVTLHPGGGSALGFVAFRLPQDARPAAVQFALNGGLADDVGHWSLS
ncbi:hypothetical protein ABZ924_17890 [Streptomyces sp. NPDC046876]|uniref:hypothetical protein n=1 Tax=Streptomyces sp. NPDC046876 TaxID=3155616 RepID=UPI003402A602